MRPRDIGHTVNLEKSAVKATYRDLTHTAISINVVGSKLQAYATRPNGSVGRSRRLLHVLNTNEV